MTEQFIHERADDVGGLGELPLNFETAARTHPQAVRVLFEVLDIAGRADHDRLVVLGAAGDLNGILAELELTDADLERIEEAIQPNANLDVAASLAAEITRPEE